VAARPAYLGLVGSAKRGTAVLGYLKDRGVPQDQLDRVRVPAGLDLGRTSHREIAVAILAELVQLRASGAVLPGGPSSAATAERGAAEQAPAETIDVVCGMTVTKGRVQLSAGARGRDLLLLLRRVPPVVPGKPGGGI